MRIGMVVVVAIAGCHPAPEMYYQARPRPAPATADGRPLLSASAARWCYGQTDTDLEGGCFVEVEACKQHRDGQIRFTLGKLYSEAKPSDIDTAEKREPYARRAWDSWTVCAERSAFACFTMDRAVTSEHLELCYPTVATCDAVLSRNEHDPDLVLKAKQCAVVRATSGRTAEATSTR